MANMNTETKFDLSELKLKVGVGEGLPERKEVLSIPVRKPSKQTYIRVNPDPTWQIETYVLELKDDDELYLVDSSLWEALRNEITPKIILSCMTRQDSFFFWSIRLPNAENWVDNWSRTALDCARIAQTQWVRIQSDRDAQAWFANIAENQDSFPNRIGQKRVFRIGLSSLLKTISLIRWNIRS